MKDDAMKKKKLVLVVLLCIVGVGLMAYPILSNLYNDLFQTRAINEYEKVIKERSPEEKEELLLEMKDYNKLLATGQIQVPISEEAPAVDFNGADIIVDGMDSEYGAMIAMLEIPSIKARIPVYNGVAETQLQRGVGVLPGTSLPTGGPNTHSVITGHRGLPQAKLFTDLPNVEIGDEFYIRVLDETLAYKVRSITTIQPTDISGLVIQPDEDLVTLLTCVPYMINTHRLLVTGYRIPYQQEEAVEEEIVVIPIEGQEGYNCCCLWVILAIVVSALLLFIGLLLILRRLGKMYRLMKDCKKEMDKENEKKKKSYIKGESTAEAAPSPAEGVKAEKPDPPKASKE